MFHWFRLLGCDKQAGQKIINILQLKGTHETTTSTCKKEEGTHSLMNASNSTHTINVTHGMYLEAAAQPHRRDPNKVPAERPGPNDSLYSIALGATCSTAAKPALGQPPKQLHAYSLQLCNTTHMESCMAPGCADATVSHALRSSNIFVQDNTHKVHGYMGTCTGG